MRIAPIAAAPALVALGLFAVTLAACGEVPEPASAPPRSAEPGPSSASAEASGDAGAVADPTAPPNGPAPQSLPPVLNRVNLSSPLKLVGTEPFWGAELGGGRLELTAPDREPVRLAVGEPVVRAGQATWKAANATVRLTAEPCSDGMSERRYPLTARVESGGVVWSGCAANAAALNRSGEGGEVR